MSFVRHLICTGQSFVAQAGCTASLHENEHVVHLHLFESVCDSMFLEASVDAEARSESDRRQQSAQPMSNRQSQRPPRAGSMYWVSDVNMKRPAIVAASFHLLTNDQASSRTKSLPPFISAALSACSTARASQRHRRCAQGQLVSSRHLAPHRRPSPPCIHAANPKRSNIWKTSTQRRPRMPAARSLGSESRRVLQPSKLVCYAPVIGRHCLAVRVQGPGENTMSTDEYDQCSVLMRETEDGLEDMVQKGNRDMLALDDCLNKKRTAFTTVHALPKLAAKQPNLVDATKSVRRESSIQAL
ncbi:hypothetical protein BCR44DRAFT_1052150 [Catenaria anguillulae PL171]|uniref:Uncharacterized protein n=1 Tax=Catenaria anguillulae PL171 TaxID=765915 RepID=A0A1Y2HVA8_9FUNG|nr:hypothetical protein BCR44DRAFT_1052150 [Catenaria anguillulae PL171]